MRNFFGTLETNSCAAVCAARRRVGGMSVAPIERETSIASSTVASSRRDAHGRVRSRDADDHRGERDEQHRDREMASGARGALDEVRQQRGRRPGGRGALSRPLVQQVRDEQQRQEQEAEQPDRRGEAHFALRRNSASSRSQSPDVDSTTWRTPTDANVARRGVARPRRLPRSVGGASRCACRREAGARSRDRRARARPRSAAPARAGRGSRPRRRRAGRRAGAAAGASRPGRGSRTRARRRSAGARARPPAGSPRRATSRRLVRDPVPGHGPGPGPGAVSRAGPSALADPGAPEWSADRRRRTSRHRGGCRAASPRDRSRSPPLPRRRPFAVPRCRSSSTATCRARAT